MPVVIGRFEFPDEQLAKRYRFLTKIVTIVTVLIILWLAFALIYFAPAVILFISGKMSESMELLDLIVAMAPLYVGVFVSARIHGKVEAIIHRSDVRQVVF